MPPQEESYMGILSSLLYLQSEVATSNLPSTHEQLKICCNSFFADLEKHNNITNQDFKHLKTLIHSVESMEHEERAELYQAIERLNVANDNIL